MAKTKTVVEAAAVISKALAKEIAATAKTFNGFAKDYGLVNQTRAEYAPKFMKLYGKYQSVTGGSFVSFIQMLDPTMPADRTAYRAHRAWIAADYLRRLVNRRSPNATAAPARSSLTNLAQTLGVIVGMVKDPEIVWQAAAAQFGFTKTQIGKLRNLTAQTRPLLVIDIAKPFPPNVIHFDAPAAKAGAKAAA